LKIDVPPSWQAVIGGEFEKPYFKSLAQFVDDERQAFPFKIYPQEDQVFASLQLTPFDKVSVVLLGQVSEEDKVRVYHSVDVFCAPNTGGESFGIVLAEAMAAGAPIVASDLDAFRMVLRGGEAGELFATGDPDALAQAAARLLDDPARRAELAQASNIRALTHTTAIGLYDDNMVVLVERRERWGISTIGLANTVVEERVDWLGLRTLPQDSAQTRHVALAISEEEAERGVGQRY